MEINKTLKPCNIIVLSLAYSHNNIVSSPISNNCSQILAGAIYARFDFFDGGGTEAETSWLDWSMLSAKFCLEGMLKPGI